MKKISIIIFFIASISGYAQTLDDQFKELRDNSESFKVYKVIKQTELNQFWKVVSDSVQSLKQEISSNENQIKLQASEIEKQNGIINSKDDEIAGLQHATTHISVLGMDLFKEAYIGITFSIIGILTIALILLYVRFRSNQMIAKQKVADWKKLNVELEELKKESLEKQMKLRRELQTHINKLNEMRSA